MAFFPAMNQFFALYLSRMDCFDWHFLFYFEFDALNYLDNKFDLIR